MHMTTSAKVAIGIPVQQLKVELQNLTPPGEQNYALFRSALRSSGAVERFLHLYNIMLMLHNDNQPSNDTFILQEEPTVSQTPSPKFPSRMETVYTRLRNEFGHKRVGR